MMVGYSRYLHAKSMIGYVYIEIFTFMMVYYIGHSEIAEFCIGFCLIYYSHKMEIFGNV